MCRQNAGGVFGAFGMREAAINAAIARRLARRREALGVTLQEIAERCGVSETTALAFERGCVPVPAAKLQLLAEALHTSASYFFEGGMAPFRPMADPAADGRA